MPFILPRGGLDQPAIAETERRAPEARDPLDVGLSRDVAEVGSLRRRHDHGADLAIWVGMGLVVVEVAVAAKKVP